MKVFLAATMFMSCSVGLAANLRQISDPVTSARHLETLLAAENTLAVVSHAGYAGGSSSDFLAWHIDHGYAVEKILYYPAFSNGESSKECIAVVYFFKPKRAQSSSIVFVKGIASIPALNVEYCQAQ